MTLIESLTVISVIGLLLSLIIPSVMDARDASQRIQCASHLRQVGIGLHQFESSNGHLPGIFSGVADERGGGRSLWSFSPSSYIAPYLGAGTSEGSIAFEQPIDGPDPDQRNATLPAPGLLKCPADGEATETASSYRYCRGVIPLWPRDPGGVFVSYRGTRLAEVADGLSNTAFSSERLVAGGETLYPARNRGYIVVTRRTDNYGLECNLGNDAPRRAWFSGAAGDAWTSGMWRHGAYYHQYIPNSTWSDCVDDSGHLQALVTARSNHPGGVNVLYGDGRVDFVTNSISTPIWGAKATRNGVHLGGE